jgi:hypothetical protein
MKIKLISLILILCCFVSVSGWAKDCSGEECKEIIRFEREHPILTKIKERAESSLTCTCYFIYTHRYICLSYIVMLYGLGLRYMIMELDRQAMEFERQNAMREERTSASATNMAR